MITDADIERFAVGSGHPWRSVGALRPKFWRIRRRLAERGITWLAPLNSRQAWLDPVAAWGHNELAVILMQARRNRGNRQDEHEVRNMIALTRPDRPIRPYASLKAKESQQSGWTSSTPRSPGGAQRMPPRFG